MPATSPLLPLFTREDASYLILRDTNWSRFQRFSVDLMSKVEAIQYAASALSFDLGRDGRTPLISTEKLSAVVCTSVKLKPQAAIAKAKSDLKRLAETGLPKRAAFYFTCELEERHKDQILQCAKQIAPDCRVRAEGVEYLSQAAAWNPQIFEGYYRGELLALRHGLLSSTMGTPRTSNGLRLALATQFGEDASVHRMAAMSNLVRLTLLGKGTLDLDVLRDQISTALGLAQRVNAAYLDAALLELKLAEEVEMLHAAVALTAFGTRTARALLDDARDWLLNGRLTFRQEIGRALENPPSDALFDDLWVRLQDRLADLFMQEGMSVVRAILDPLPGASKKPPFANTPILQKLANGIVPATLPRKDAQMLAQAILSVLTGETNTRSWLSQVAATFVSICALGLHPEAQEELLERLRHWSLIVDNHVVISFLCEAEDDHQGVIRVIDAWRKLNREAVTCEAVLEEAAYHAHAADLVYDENWRDLPTMSTAAATELIKNAFVRAFHKVSGRAKTTSQFRYDRVGFCLPASAGVVARGLIV